MTYRQILDEYKKNALPEEKQKEVAADIEARSHKRLSLRRIRNTGHKRSFFRTE